MPRFPDHSPTKIEKSLIGGWTKPKVFNMYIDLLAGFETFNLIGNAKCSLMFGPFVAGIKAMERSRGFEPSEESNSKVKKNTHPSPSLKPKWKRHPKTRMLFEFLGNAPNF